MRSSHLSPTSTIDIHEIGVLDAGFFPNWQDGRTSGATSALRSSRPYA